MNFLAGKVELWTNLWQNPSGGGQCIVLIRKLQDSTNNLIERAFIHISMVWRKIDNNVAVKFLRRRAMHCSD